MSVVSGDPQKGKKTDGGKPRVQSSSPSCEIINYWTKASTMKMRLWRPEEGTWQIWEGRQHRQPEPGCAASSDTSSRSWEAEQALPGSRERIHPLTESWSTSSCWRVSAQSSLGSRKELGAQEIKPMRCYSWQRHILDQKGCQDTLLEDESVS